MCIVEISNKLVYLDSDGNFLYYLKTFDDGAGGNLHMFNAIDYWRIMEAISENEGRAKEWYMMLGRE